MWDNNSAQTRLSPPVRPSNRARAEGMCWADGMLCRTVMSPPLLLSGDGGSKWDADGRTTGEQNLHLKPFRWMKKARGGNEKLKSLGREMKDTAMSGNRRAGPPMGPLQVSVRAKHRLRIPPLCGRGGPRAQKGVSRRTQTFGFLLNNAAQCSAARGGLLAPNLSDSLWVLPCSGNCETLCISLFQRDPFGFPFCLPLSKKK